MTTNEKLALLRHRMQEENLDAYYVPTSDPHMSEYIAPCYQSRAWLSGFSGSAGAVLVFPDEAKLWTDGRYFIQAAAQTKDSEFELMKQATPGYPPLLQYLVEKLPQGARVGVNGAILSQQEVESISARLESKQAALILNKPLVEEIWADRPSAPQAPIFLLAEEFSGRATEAKLSGLRESQARDGADATLFGRLDDIAWLFNIRGGDVANTPVALAYALVTGEEAFLFIDEAKVSDEIRSSLAAAGVSVRAYEAVGEALAALSGKILNLDKRALNSAVYAGIPSDCEVRDERDWTTWQKAIKNETEIYNQREAYRKDGLAVTRLIYWLKHLPDVSAVDELDVSDKLYALHLDLEHFIEPSFTTIAAYGPNAAMMHYAPTRENKAALAAAGFLLVDSGGQYLEGTTDTTRTIAMGPLTADEIRDYTLTLKGHIALASAIFLHGATGHYLDALARQPLWKHHSDYKSGTGHGVGYLLGVHEGPQNISSRPIDTMLVPGMVVTNEPGVYKEGLYGIRIENVYVVELDGEVDSDRFYRFSNFTRVPLEREAIDVRLLTDDEIAWIDAFHAETLAGLKNDLTADEASWLEAVCRPLSREALS